MRRPERKEGTILGCGNGGEKGSKKGNEERKEEKMNGQEGLYRNGKERIEAGQRKQLKRKLKDRGKFGRTNNKGTGRRFKDEQRKDGEIEEETKEKMWRGIVGIRQGEKMYRNGRRGMRIERVERTRERMEGEGKGGEG